MNLNRCMPLSMLTKLPRYATDPDPNGPRSWEIIQPPFRTTQLQPQDQHTKMTLQELPSSSYPCSAGSRSQVSLEYEYCDERVINEGLRTTNINKYCRDSPIQSDYIEYIVGLNRIYCRDYRIQQDYIEYIVGTTNIYIEYIEGTIQYIENMI